MPNYTCTVCASNNIGRFCTKRRYEVWVCHDCKSYFTNVFTEKKLLDSTYNEAYYNGGNHVGGFINYDIDKKSSLGYWQAVLNNVTSYVQKGTLLDVGAATGLFMQLANQAGWITDGVEVSDAAIHLAKLNGVRVTSEEAKDSLKKEEYDVITMFDVLEHVSNPVDFVVGYSGFLKKGGILVINTPNNTSWWAKLTGTRWNAINPPEHTVLLNTNSLATLLKSCGYTVLVSSVPSKKFRLSYVFHTLGRVSGFNYFISTGKFICNTKLDFSLPLNLHDNVLVYAKKL